MQPKREHYFRFCLVGQDFPYDTERELARLSGTYLSDYAETLDILVTKQNICHSRITFLEEEAEKVAFEMRHLQLRQETLFQELAPLYSEFNQLLDKIREVHEKVKAEHESSPLPS